MTDKRLPIINMSLHAHIVCISVSLRKETGCEFPSNSVPNTIAAHRSRGKLNRHRLRVSHNCPGLATLSCSLILTPLRCLCSNNAFANSFTCFQRFLMKIFALSYFSSRYSSWYSWSLVSSMAPLKSPAAPLLLIAPLYNSSDAGPLNKTNISRSDHLGF